MSERGAKMADDAVTPKVEANPLCYATEADAIKAAFPTRTGRHDLYSQAMRMVGARHAKGELIALVNWLLFRLDNANDCNNEAWARVEQAEYERDAAIEALRPFAEQSCVNPGPVVVRPGPVFVCECRVCKARALVAKYEAHENDE